MTWLTLKPRTLDDPESIPSFLWISWETWYNSYTPRCEQQIHISLCSLCPDTLPVEAQTADWPVLCWGTCIGALRWCLGTMSSLSCNVSSHSKPWNQDPPLPPFSFHSFCSSHCGDTMSLHSHACCCHERPPYCWPTWDAGWRGRFYHIHIHIIFHICCVSFGSTHLAVNRFFDGFLTVIKL